MAPGSKVFFRLTKPVIFLLGLAPFIYLLLNAFSLAGPGLGANPVEELQHETGRWGLRFLLMTLCITPLRRWTGWTWLIRYRRMLGLFAFFYTLVHFLNYAVLDQGLDGVAIYEDVIKRPYITLGMTGLVLLIPLAITSTRGMMRRLGKRWKKLHSLVYLIAILGTWHFFWQEKLDTLDATVYAVILALLLVTRIHHKRRQTVRIQNKSSN